MPIPSIQNGDTLLLNSSKSVLIRQLVLEALYGDHLSQPQADDSVDVWVVFHALNIIKQNINKSLQNIDNNFITIDVKDCGAGYRFLMAVAAVTPGKWLLTGTKRLLERPVAPLVEALKSAGADIERCDTGWQISGKELHTQRLCIDCSQSSQMASALLLAGRHAFPVHIGHILPQQVGKGGASEQLDMALLGASHAVTSSQPFVVEQVFGGFARWIQLAHFK